MDSIKSILSHTKEKWIFTASIIFILVNAFLIGTERDFFVLIPPLLIFILVYILFPVKFYLVYLILSPLSIQLSEFFPDLPFDIWVPSELMLVALTPIALLMMRSENSKIQWLAWNPVLLTIYFFLGWLTVTSVTSTIPLVSLKYLVLKILYFIVLLYLPFIHFVNSTVSFKKVATFYTIGMLAVIIITLSKQWQNGLFDKFVAHGSCNPFFVDHTSYAATLALLIPVSIAFYFSSESSKSKVLFLLLSVILLLALILSYTRAAWLSLMVAGVVWVAWLLKIRFRYLALLAILFFGSILYFQDNILIWLNQNKTASSGDIRKHISSIANIRTDESNVERLNRWTSAIRMFEEKPLLGWGPGTYMFQYAPYQASYLKTRESSNLGLKGNAHSEYLGLLSEAGLPAALAFFLIIILLLYKGFRLALKLKPKSDNRNIVIGVLLGLITYIVHGIMNNFLDMDKVALLFWGYAAYILATEYSYSKSNPSIEISSKTSASDSLS